MERLEEISVQLIVKWSAETETPTTYDLSSLLTCRAECGNGVRCSNAIRLLVLSAFTLLNGVKKIRLEGANNYQMDLRFIILFSRDSPSLLVIT